MGILFQMAMLRQVFYLAYKGRTFWNHIQTFKTKRLQFHI